MNLIFETKLGLFVHLLTSFSGLSDGKASAFVFVTEIPIGVACVSLISTLAGGILDLDGTLFTGARFVTPPLVNTLLGGR